MFSKIFSDDERGLTYTIEAILGVSLIIGTVIFVTGNMPYMAQKTGEHSKVQLVNIGRDVLDLAELTPITDIFSNYSKNQGVNRTYTLIANKTFAAPDEVINFTVFYLDTNISVKEPLNLDKSKIGNNPAQNKINTSFWMGYTCPLCYVLGSLSSNGEYSIIAYDGTGTNYSNAVIITVGNYFLVADVSGIYANGNVSGTVYYPNWSAAPNLSIQICSDACNNSNVIVSLATETNGTGNFSFIWPGKTDNNKNINTGTYYIRAIDSSNFTSNDHEILYSDKNNGALLCCDTTIYETDSVNLTITNGTISNSIENILTINGIKYNQWNFPYSSEMYLTWHNDTEITLTAYSSGTYTIQILKQGSSPQTNGIIITVLPLKSKCLFEDCKPICGGLNMSDLNFYFRTFVPEYVNYNIYLINPDGKLCTDCREFKEIINGYPTDEAVTVNKLFQIKYQKPGVSGQYLEGLKELRMVLWYK